MRNDVRRGLQISALCGFVLIEILLAILGWQHHQLVQAYAREIETTEQVNLYLARRLHTISVREYHDPRVATVDVGGVVVTGRIVERRK